ncbi:hypothetical protein L1887_55211 [Cichorium endivia]|nr:hypothetical protein L1887_55211 [Cichorium endivia]
MDASADDPQRFRIRRSPSIGTSAAAVGPASTRSGKRKLSTAAFASSPSMAPHPPSSPITSEHPTDELKLKQGIQTASQATSTSRSTVDASDATSSNAESSSAAAAHPNASASHAQFHEWQDQRRCHSVLADYDYLHPTEDRRVHPTEDRRDPRSSNAASSCQSRQQSQTVACSSAHDRPASEMESHTSLQPPPIALQHDDDSANDGTCDTAPSHTGLGPSASLPLSPECNVLALTLVCCLRISRHTSPCLSASYRPHCRKIDPGTASASTSASASSHRLSSIAESSNERTGPTDACSTNHTAIGDVAPWDESDVFEIRPSRAAVSVRRLARRRTMHRSRQIPFACSPFRLRSVESWTIRSPGATHAGLGTPARIDDARRSSDAGIASDSAQVRNSVDKKAGEALFEDKPGFLNHTQRAALVPYRSANRSCVTVRSEDFVGTRRSPRPIHRCEKRCHAPATSKHNAHAEAIQRKQHAWPSRKYSRLTRAHSVPNLRAKATLDVSAPSHHRLILPSHLAGYVSSQSRQSRSGQNGSKGSTMRLSQGAATEPRSLLCWNKQLTLRDRRLHPRCIRPITRHTAARARPARDPQEPAAPSRRSSSIPTSQFRPNFDGERGRRKRGGPGRGTGPLWSARSRPAAPAPPFRMASFCPIAPVVAKGRSLPAGCSVSAGCSGWPLMASGIPRAGRRCPTRASRRGSRCWSCSTACWMCPRSSRLGVDPEAALRADARRGDRKDGRGGVHRPRHRQGSATLLRDPRADEARHCQPPAAVGAAVSGGDGG